MPARKKVWTPDIVRKRIQVSMLVRRLNEHALGQVEMTPTQIKAAEILLRKAVPDLKSVEHSGQIRHVRVEELSDAELATIAAGRSERTADATPGPQGPSGVH